MTAKATAPDLLEQLRQAAEAAQRGDLDQASSIFAADAIWDSARNGLGRFEGAASVRAFWGDWFGAYEELQFAFEELVDFGGGVVFSLICQTVRVPGAAAPIRERDGLIWLWDDGLCSSVTVYPEADIDEGRAAAERLAAQRSSARRR